jgi:hypothetical protein
VKTVPQVETKHVLAASDRRVQSARHDIRESSCGIINAVPATALVRLVRVPQITTVLRAKAALPYLL